MPLGESLGPDWSQEPANDDLLGELVPPDVELEPAPRGSGLETGLGLFRDLVVSAIALASILGVTLTEDQKTDVLMFVSTAAAFGTWAYRAYRARRRGQ